MDMENLNSRVMELLQQGYHCSQVMMLLSMELRGIEDEFTIRTLGALGGGMFCQRACGTLTGGVCALSSYIKREPGAPEPREYQKLAKEYVAWFEAENGSLDCRDLVEFKRESIMNFCPGLMARSFAKVVEILQQNDIDPSA